MQPHLTPVQRRPAPCERIFRRLRAAAWRESPAPCPVRAGRCPVQAAPWRVRVHPCPVSIAPWPCVSRGLGVCEMTLGACQSSLGARKSPIRLGPFRENRCGLAQSSFARTAGACRNRSKAEMDEVKLAGGKARNERHSRNPAPTSPAPRRGRGKAYAGIARTIFIVSTLTVQTRASRAITASLWSAKR